MVKSLHIKKSTLKISVCGTVVIEDTQADIIEVTNDMLYNCQT